MRPGTRPTPVVPLARYRATRQMQYEVVVITGGAGFVGRRLCTALLNEPGVREVRLFDRRAPSHVADARVSHVQGDIRNRADVQRALEGAECVFHVASYGMSGGEMLASADLIQEINVTGTKNVVSACFECGVRRLIYTSTYNVVFGGQEIIDGTEDLPYFPLHLHPDSYAPTKTRAEQIVLAAGGQRADGRKLTTCALRPAAIYGDGEERHFPRIIANMRRNLFLFTIGAAATRVDWVYVDNFAHAQMCAARAAAAAVNGAAFFISDGSPVNNFEFLRPLCEGLGFDFPRVALPARLLLPLAAASEALHRAARPLLHLEPFLTRAEVYKVAVTHTMRLDKARRQLGYAPVVPPAEALRRTVRHYQREQRHVFQWAGAGWYVAIVLGLLLCAAVAYDWRLPGTDPVHALGLAIFRSRRVVVWVFWAAVLAHVGEAAVALRIAREMQDPHPTAWALQTLVLGFPSLRLLKRRRRLFADLE